MKSVLYAVSGALVIAGLALAVPVAAQDRGPQGQGAGGGVHSGGAGMGGAGGGGNNGPAGSAGMSGNSGGSTGGTSSGGFSGGGFSGSGSSGGGFSGGGPASGGASPMGGGGFRGMGSDRGGRPAGGGAMLRGDSTRNAAAADPSNRAIPGGSRPNYGNPTIGAAVPRGSNTQPGDNTRYYYGADYYNNYYWANPYYGGAYGYYGSFLPGCYYPGFFGSYWCGSYSGYGSFWYSPYGRYWASPYDPFFLYGYGAFGMGSFYYDPAWWGGGAYPAYDRDAYTSGSSGLQDRAGTPSGPKGGLKIKVTPKEAEVYVDGYFIGIVDDYNGAFQRLELPAGAHRVEIRAKGYQPVNFEVNIEPRDTITYHGAMQALQPVK